MPNDYYVSQYSGEEIDALLGGAGAGTVRYDTAQTLADAQKAQARANIAAAPDGFGLGKGIAHEVVPDCNDVKLSGLYIMSSNTTNYPTLIPNGQYSLLRVSARTADAILQEVFCVGIDGQSDFSAVRSYGSTGVWSPWEYVNPPMKLGVEYRTTERYIGKPVYTQIINCGSMPNIGSQKSISIATLNVAVVTFISGWCTYYASMFDANLLLMTMSANNANIVVTNLNRTVDANAVMYARIKYTKNTD